MSDPAEKATLEALSRRLRGPLRRFFEKRLGRRDDEVEDLVQEVFVRLVNGTKLDSVRNVEAYLFQTAANLLRDRWRRRASREADLHDSYDDVAHGAAGTLSPEHEVLSQEQIERLIAALRALPERTRNVWMLYHYEDMRHAQIASELGIGQSTVERHMKIATEHLLKVLNRCK
ncbi:MAG TPA: sigma-70 family RNA polymerase sigma factor [Steroidobacteraceae bacterium]